MMPIDSVYPNFLDIISLAIWFLNSTGRGAEGSPNERLKTCLFLFARYWPFSNISIA